MEWTIRIDETEYKAPSIETLREWYGQGRLKPEHYVFHPVLGKWMYAKDLEELRPARLLTPA